MSINRKIPIKALLFTLITLFTFAISHTASSQEPVIIDHTCTDITQIPAYWLEQAKRLTIHYAHTSHGSQVNSGILKLESQNSTYSVAIRTSSTEGLPQVEDPPALRMYDGNPDETYIQPNDYWEGEDGKDRTRGVANTGHYDFSMWSWCGQVSGATETYIQNYLDTLNRFETEYPGMRFIYMTGHLDGGGSTGNLHVRNQQIRDYCIANDKVLFDFADIERYDPDGTDYLDLGANDSCGYSGGNWADEWCGTHTGSDLCASCSCAHSKPLNCNQKARAFWWMMARLAGWDPDGTITVLTPEAGDIIPSGSEYQISWESPAEAETFKLKYSTDNGATWIRIDKEIEITGISHDWTVPTPRKNKKKCLVKVNNDYIAKCYMAENNSILATRDVTLTPIFAAIISNSYKHTIFLVLVI